MPVAEVGSPVSVNPKRNHVVPLNPPPRNPVESSFLVQKGSGIAPKAVTIFLGLFGVLPEVRSAGSSSGTGNSMSGFTEALINVLKEPAMAGRSFSKTVTLPSDVVFKWPFKLPTDSHPPRMLAFFISKESALSFSVTVAEKDGELVRQTIISFKDSADQDGYVGPFQIPTPDFEGQKVRIREYRFVEKCNETGQPYSHEVRIRFTLPKRGTINVGTDRLTELAVLFGVKEVCENPPIYEREITDLLHEAISVLPPAAQEVAKTYMTQSEIPADHELIKSIIHLYIQLNHGAVSTTKSGDFADYQREFVDTVKKMRGDQAQSE